MYTNAGDPLIEMPATSSSSESYIDSSMNVSGRNSSDSSSLDFETKSELQVDMPLATDSNLQGFNGTKQVFFSSYSSDVNGDDWNEYQNCEEYSAEEKIRTRKRTVSFKLFQKDESRYYVPRVSIIYSRRIADGNGLQYTISFHV